MKTYSLDLRIRIVEAVDRHVGSQGAVAALFGVSRTFVKKLLRQRRETGSVAPKPHGGGQPPRLDTKKEEAVRSYILEVKNDASLVEVQTHVARRWKVDLSEATVSRLLARLGLPRKKNFRGQ
jgi:transposase